MQTSCIQFASFNKYVQQHIGRSDTSNSSTAADCSLLRGLTTGTFSLDSFDIEAGTALFALPGRSHSMRHTSLKVPR